MVYGRQFGDRELSFEASGALWNASLVMRDRETDSWWSIMTSTAIGGAMDGAALDELPVGEKTTFGEWVAQHPETLVLSVSGIEHVENNPYDTYFASDGTFRDLEIDDTRLEPKASIYAFFVDGRPWAVAHAAFEGGATIDIDERTVFLHREAGASIFASTRAYFVSSELENVPATDLGQRVDAGALAGLEPIGGFDTFWYSWVSINAETGLVD